MFIFILHLQICVQPNHLGIFSLLVFDQDHSEMLIKYLEALDCHWNL